MDWSWVTNRRFVLDHRTQHIAVHPRDFSGCIKIGLQLSTVYNSLDLPKIQV